MVSVSGAPHFRYTHDILGMVTIILISCTLLIGYHISRTSTPGTGIPKLHRLLGYTCIALMAINIFLGFSMMSMVLAQ